MNFVAAMRYKLATVELLAYVKEQHTYRELAELTGLPETVLSRYEKEHVLPTIERARELSCRLLSLANIQELIASKLQQESDGYFDTTGVIGDPVILRLAVHHALNDFYEKHVTKVVATSTSGIPLATVIAHSLGRLQLVLAKAEREAGVARFIECEYHAEGNSLQSLYLPKEAIHRGDSVLVVDGSIQDHRADLALTKMLLEKAKVRVVGIFTLIAEASEWKALCTCCPEITANAIFQTNTGVR